MWINSERVFKTMALHPNLVAAQARALINQLLDEPLMGSETFAALVESCASDSVLGKQLFNRTAVGLVMELPDEAREKIGLQMNRIADQAELAVARQRHELDAMTARAARHRAQVATERAEKAEAELARARAALRDAQCQAAPTTGAAEPLADATLPAKARPLHPAPGQPQAPTAPKQKGCPLWSAFVPQFLNEKTRKAEDHKPYDAQTVRQTEATMHLWTAFLGDRPVNAYDGSDAASFRDLMLRLPASHGKNGPRAQLRRDQPPQEMIRRADQRQQAIDARNARLAPSTAREPDVPRLKMKTLKRHFSTLSQCWAYAAMLGYVPRDSNPFRGWTYQGVRRGRKYKKRGPWSVEDLNTLLHSSWFGQERRGSDQWWVTLIGMWSGLRVEEIARLRPNFDIQDIEKIPSFIVQAQPAPEAWSPKTEAGERVVPIHSRLLHLGILDLVARRRQDGAYRLFPSLQRRSSSTNLSAKFVSDFSRHKRGLGIGPKTTFHSFRHNISTVLRNTALSELRESWIDSTLGHAGSDDDEGRNRGQSEGVTTYLDSIGIQNLRATVEAIHYGEGVDFSVLEVG
jgi:integrase